MAFILCSDLSFIVFWPNFCLKELETKVMNISLEGSDSLLVRIDGSGWVVCTVLAVYRAPSSGRSAFLGDIARVMPTLPSRFLIVGDVSFDQNFDNNPDS